jgi:hypothetical protein
MVNKANDEDDEDEDSEENPCRHSILLCLAHYMGIVKQTNAQSALG